MKSITDTLDKARLKLLTERNTVKRNNLSSFNQTVEFDDRLDTSESSDQPLETETKNNPPSKYKKNGKNKNKEEYPEHVINYLQKRLTETDSEYDEFSDVELPDKQVNKKNKKKNKENFIRI